jgi:hypothetical protein
VGLGAYRDFMELLFSRPCVFKYICVGNINSSSCRIVVFRFAVMTSGILPQHVHVITRIP